MNNPEDLRATISQVLEKCNDTRTLQFVLKIVKNLMSGEDTAI